MGKIKKQFWNNKLHLFLLMHDTHTEIMIKVPRYVLNCWNKRTVTPLLVLVNFDYGLKDC